MHSITDILTDLFSKAISSAYPDVPEAPVVIALSGNNPKFGDYQCNSALPIANIFKQTGKKQYSCIKRNLKPTVLFHKTE